MFDDLHPEPEDMFDETDKAAPQLNPPTAPMMAAASVDPAPTPAFGNFPPSADAKKSPWKAILLMVAILVVVAGALFLSMKILSSQTDVVPEPPVLTDTQIQPEDTQAPSAQEQNKQAPALMQEPEKTPSRTDTDKDGLTDEEETALGTSSKTADTDADELFDFEEVNTWGTDPMNPDTDADGYLDGAEVKAGYNPNGEGVLREAPSESS